MLYKDFLKTIRGCAFCDNDRVVLCDNDRAKLLYALAPYHKHHLLVVPKRHLELLEELGAEEQEAIDQLIDDAVILLRKLKYNNFSILVRDGMEAGKSVPHLHYHVIPDIRLGDVDHLGALRRVLDPEEEAALLKELKEAEKSDLKTA